jgi:D-alanyl-lipoteichoic acid acyltransferase DltB (MBOAT superfamily)
MAIGLGRMFNLHYPMNFASPYKARSVIDYWQRWHMTLTRFLMRRLYAPLTVLVLRWRRQAGLAVDRKAQRQAGGFAMMLALPLLTTMAVAGIWHGNGWTYLAFGLLHGVFLSVNHAWRIFRSRKRSDAALTIGWQVLLTHLCVLIGAVMFRAPSVSAALSLLRSMAGLHGLLPVAPTDIPPTNWHAELHAMLNMAWLSALYSIVWIAPNTQQIIDRVPGARIAWQPTLPWAVAFGCAATLGLLSIGGTGEFVYFQF